MYLARICLVILAVTAAAWIAAVSLRADVIPAVFPKDLLADSIYVDKSERRLELRRAGGVLRSYKIALGGNPVGPKRQEGDERTPEGHYEIDFRKADSDYHLSLHINYPNAQDRAASLKMGVQPGGAIFIHGLPNAYPLSVAPKVDWTLGCIALDNAEIEEIWRLVPDGTPVTIVP
ncbi:L,D-transpeptidase family protein [Dongia rigui]|uniref:L,D-transpeptidase family protein n=1 Tax=Dongia rigui TaxID=940149 RepID=A0ABU5E583_9PROT|nr:L,D-transpeptidase family protein [Dongia rigui]MDY0874098.1 L,D-transpeptidase family protein [Dongia rigui]